MRLFRPAQRPVLAALTALVAIVLSLLGSVAHAMPAVPKPPPPGAPAFTARATTDPPYDKATAPWGPDVSGWEHPAGGGINWAAVRTAGASFAFVKASEGTGYTSPYYRADVAAAHAQGLYVGAYHFARPSLPVTTSATAQANYFATIIGDVRGRGWLPPVLDLEVTGGLGPADLTAWARIWLQRVQARTGRVPIMYQAAWFWRGYMNNPSGFSRYPLWDALYNTSLSSPGTLFGDWTRTTFWQYTWQRSVPGIRGGMDASYFHGTRAQLAALANTATTVADYRQTVFAGCPDIRRGSTGPCVRDWQHFLNLWFGTRYAKLGEDGNFGALTESRQRIWEAQARARPWLYTDVVQNLIVQRPEYTRARNHLLFFRIRW